MGRRILILGNGGREHALAIALAKDPATTELFVAPGNPGTAKLATNKPCVITKPESVVALAQEVQADLVVIGPEAPLVAGVTDALREAGFAVFGPSQAAAQLEGSKTFAKDVMRDAGVPTADSLTCQTLAEAAAALSRFGSPYVVKDDGLAGGKGVLVTTDRDAALDHAHHGNSPVVIEEYLDGPEVSLFVVTDGTAAIPLLPAQDFKRVGDGDTGPNTGGMGAYCPLPWAPADLVDDVMRTVVTPTLAEMRRRETPFTGLLYVGLALTNRGLRVVEFNARFGDPEAQVVLALLKTPLGDLLDAAATGRLADFPELEWEPGYAVTVVYAAKGYPAGPLETSRLRLKRDVHDEYVVHAGTALNEDGHLVAAGGRVLGCVGIGGTLRMAREKAYDLASDIDFPAGFTRTDIAAVAAQEA